MSNPTHRFLRRFLTVLEKHNYVSRVDYDTQGSAVEFTCNQQSFTFRVDGFGNILGVYETTRPQWLSNEDLLAYLVGFDNSKWKTTALARMKYWIRYGG